ncbi:MAG: hypothetical protein Ta2A_11580 [Treponemataceae bacterium]|nr:MAG: hypothetical protein Ta2A_11580 [Treponemataceae bacterium]
MTKDDLEWVEQSALENGIVWARADFKMAGVFVNVQKCLNYETNKTWLFYLGDNPSCSQFTLYLEDCDDERFIAAMNGDWFGNVLKVFNARDFNRGDKTDD